MPPEKIKTFEKPKIWLINTIDNITLDYAENNKTLENTGKNKNQLQLKRTIFRMEKLKMLPIYHQRKRGCSSPLNFTHNS